LTETVGCAFDVDALRDKYARERARRLRPDGIDQYVEIAGEFARFAEDPWVDGTFAREPLTDEVDVAIVGAGFGGLLTGARLRELGVESVRLIDKAADVGGTWYWNRYPGIACDVESYVYIPLLEELGYIPAEKYAKGPEIFAHCRRIAEHYDLYRDACLQTDVHEISWDARDSRWVIHTDRGDEMRAKFVSMANGYQAKPKLPGIPGLGTFRGHTFHTSRWDYGYTGAQLENLAGLRVGIIGTGATAIQCVPHLAAAAQRLYVFQRTPSSVDLRGNEPTDPQWAATLRPGWQEQRKRNFHRWSPLGEGAVFDEPDMVCDFWTELGRNLTARIAAADDPTALSIEQIMTFREEEDYKVMERLRRRVEEVVDDPETAEALKPYYRFMCKRPCSNDEYLPTFNRQNVTLVDVSESKGVERLTEKGIVANGVEYEVDCVIFASGFEITTDISRRYAIDVIEGRDGLSLFDHWRDGYKSLHGMTSRGFPNQFFTGFIQGGVAGNTTAMLEQQAEHIAYIISEALARRATSVEPSQEAQDSWVATIRETSIDASEFAVSCTPGYYNNEGGGGGEGIRSAIGDPYMPGFYVFDELLKEWRAKGDLDGLVLGS